MSCKIIFGVSLLSALSFQAGAQTVLVNPVLPTPDNVTTFNSLMTAINSFQTIGKVTAASPGGVGVNSGNAAPDVINVVSGTVGVVDEIVRIDERSGSAGYAVLGEKLTIQGPGAGAEPSALNNAYVALRDDGALDDDGFEIRTEQDLEVRNITFYPSLTTPPGDDMVTVDRLTPGLNANLYTFQSCVFTTAKAGNLPVVTSKSEAYVNSRADIATPAAAQDKLFSVFPDANEGMVVNTTDCVFSHSIDGDAILELSPRYTDASSTFSFNIASCVITHNSGAANRYGIQVAAAGSVNASRSSLNITGSNAGAGPSTGLGGPTVILGNYRGIQTFAGNSTDTNEHFPLNISETIVAENSNRQISMDANVRPVFNDLITSGPVPFVYEFEDVSTSVNWNRITAVSGTASSLFGKQGAGAAVLTLRDTILAGNGTTAKAIDVFGTALDMKLDIDFSAVVLSGPHRVQAFGGNTMMTSGTNIISDDPQFASMSATNPAFADVTSCAYDNKGTSGSDLAGGADFVAICARVREWLDY